MEQLNMKITEKEFNVETGEETIIERDATPDEIATYEKVQTEAAEIAAKEAEATAAKAALLEKLGITEEEAKLLLS
jgi:hypothetical protein